MLLRNLVLSHSGEVYKVPLYSEGNFETESSILGDNFTITVRTYQDFFSYFTIVLNNTQHLCIMTLARLGINLCYAPVTTLDDKRHVFYLRSQDRKITRVHHSLFANGIDLIYFQCPTEAVLKSLIL